MWFLDQVKNKRTYSTLDQLNAALSFILGAAGYPEAAAVQGGATAFNAIIYYVMKNREVFRRSEELHREIVTLTDKLRQNQLGYPFNGELPDPGGRPEKILGYFNYSPNSIFFNA